MSLPRSATVASPQSAVSSRPSMHSSPRQKANSGTDAAALAARRAYPFHRIDLGKAMAHDSQWDEENDELGLNQVDLEELFGKESLASSRKSLELPRLNKEAKERKSLEEKYSDLGTVPEREDRQPSFSGKDELASKKEEQPTASSSQLVSFADDVIQRVKTTSVSSGSSTASDPQKKEIAALKGQKQQLMQQLAESAEKVTALKREVQDLKWDLETARASRQTMLDETKKLDLARGTFLEMEQERSQVEQENERLRQMLSAAMKEKLLVLALKEENERLKKEIADLRNEEATNSAAQKLATDLQNVKAEVVSKGEALAEAQVLTGDLRTRVAALESALALSRRENDLLAAQAQSFAVLLESARTQQENLSTQLNEYSTALLAKQSAYNELLQKYSDRKQRTKVLTNASTSSQKLLQEEVRKRLAEKLQKP